MRKSWKRAAWLSAIITLSFSAGVLADQGVQKVEAFIRKDFHIALDGQPLTLEQPPLIYNNRTYLPLTALSKLLNVDVNWDALTSTVYINSRFQGQPVVPRPNEPEYKLIEIDFPRLYKVKYLGGSDHVVTLMKENTTYYRVMDMERIGIDCRPLAKVKERYTEALYVTESELAKVWKQKPVFEPEYETVITGENDPKKRDLLKRLAIDIPTAASQLGSSGGVPAGYRGAGMIFVIDRLLDKKDDHVFGMLSFEMGKYYLYEVTLRQNQDGDWYHSGYSKINLQPDVNPNQRYR